MTREAAATWRNAIPWILASVPFAFMAAWFWNRGPGFSADDYAHTLLHAQALIDGRPYSDTGYIGSSLEIVGSVQPPGLPLVVAGVMKLAGGFHWGLIRLAMALTSVPFILLAGAYFARSHGRPMGLAVVPMATVAGGVWALHIQPDLGFAGLVWALLFLLDRPTAVTWPTVLGVFLLATGAMSYRYLGAALVPTIALFALLSDRPRARRLGWLVAIWGVAALGLVAVEGLGFITQQVSLDPVRFFRRIVPMIRLYGVPAAEAHLYPLPWNWGNDVFHVVSLSLAVLGVVVWTRKSWRSGAWLFTASYLILLDMVYAQTGRYLIPLYPVLIFGFLNGARVVFDKLLSQWPEKRVSRAVFATGAVVAISALTRTVATEPRTGGYIADLPETQALFAYFRDDDPVAGKRVALNPARVFTWNTGIPAMILMGTPPELTVPELDRLNITHVVLDRLDIAPWRSTPMRGTIANYRCRFEMTYDNEAFEVYRLHAQCPADEATDELTEPA